MTRFIKIGFIATLMLFVFIGCGSTDNKGGEFSSTEYNGGRLFEDNKGKLTFFFKSLDVSGFNGKDVTSEYRIYLKSFSTENYTDNGKKLRNNFQYEGSEGPFMLSILNKKLNRSFGYQFTEHLEKLQFFGPNSDENIRKEFKGAEIVKNKDNATVYINGKNNIFQGKLDLTELTLLTGALFSFTDDFFYIEDKEGRDVEYYEELVVGEIYTFSLKSFINGYNNDNPVLIAKEKFIMEKDLNFVNMVMGLYTEKISAPVSLEIDEEVIAIYYGKEEIKFNKNDGILSFNMYIGSYVTIITEFNEYKFELTPSKLFSHLNGKSYSLVKTAPIPYTVVTTNGYKVSQKKDFSSFFNEEFYNVNGEQEITVQIYIDNFVSVDFKNLGKSEVSLEFYDKMDNKISFSKDEWYTEGYFILKYTNEPGLDFELYFNKDMDLCYLLGHCEEGGNLPQPSKDDQDEVELPKV